MPLWSAAQFRSLSPEGVMRCYFTGHQLFRSAVFSGQELCSSATRNSSPEMSGIRARCETRPGASPKQSLCSGSKARMSELNADHLRSEETEVIDFRHGTFACFHHPESRRVTQSHAESRRVTARSSRTVAFLPEQVSVLGLVHILPSNKALTGMFHWQSSSRVC